MRVVAHALLCLRWDLTLNWMMQHHNKRWFPLVPQLSVQVGASEPQRASLANDEVVNEGV